MLGPLRVVGRMTDPLFVLDMPEEEYHSHSALSASGMKVLLKSPAAFVQSRRVRVEKAEFDVGHAVHARVLGLGAPVVEIPDGLLASNGAASTKASKEFIAKARADGQVPLKSAVYAQVVAGAESVLANPKARRLLEREGHSEVSMFATDPETGVRLRGRADRVAGSQILDVKTTVDVSLHKLSAVVNSYGYDCQAETYRFLFELCTGEVAEPVVLIFMEKEPPYDVRVVRLGDLWIEGGWAKMRRAVRRFAECSASGVWPGIDAEDGPVGELEPPGWYAGWVDAESAVLDAERAGVSA